MQQLFVPLQIGFIVLGVIVIVVGAVIGDPVLMLMGALVTAFAITALGFGLRVRRRQQAWEAQQRPRR